jgi:hypothetical protein
VLVPNLLGMWVYTDVRCPRFDPPKLIGDGCRYYIHPDDIDAFHRWEAAQRPIEWRYQYDLCQFGIPPSDAQLNRRRLQEAVIKVAEQLSDPMRLGFLGRP